MRLKLSVAGALALCTVLTAWGQIRESSGNSAPAVYKVTPWPPHSEPGASYIPEVEQYLNRMAADGWKFHSTMVGQTAPMMVFERTGR